MKIAICILAKDEARTIAENLSQLSRQSIVTAGHFTIDVHVVANGCTDDTAALARSVARESQTDRLKFFVHSVQPGGKSRAWNLAVHELIDPATEYIVFVDADITFASQSAIADLLDKLQFDANLAACTGFPVKDVDIVASKKIVDRFSVLVSERTRHVGVINGSLYVARMAALLDVWLPNQTPSEDGFVNAMLTTNGFTRPDKPSVISGPDGPTHSFKAHNPLQFVAHERRMIVGTMINRWIFEHLWSLRLETPAGYKIREWNTQEPDWVDRLVAKRASRSKWLIPGAIMFYRFHGRRGRPWWKHAAYLPVAAMATLMTLPPAILANRRLKEIGAAATW